MKVVSATRPRNVIRSSRYITLKSGRDGYIVDLHTNGFNVLDQGQQYIEDLPAGKPDWKNVPLFE